MDSSISRAVLLFSFWLVASPLTAHGESDEIETVFIAGGKFKLGTPIKNTRDPEYHADEAPLDVQVRAFRIGKFPVTAEQMCQFLNSEEAKKHTPEDLYYHHDMTAVGSTEILKYSTITVESGLYVPRSGAAKSPANCVTWKGAVLFCEWRTDLTGKKTRLPSEAEWEFAARGERGRTWPWGEQPPEPQHGHRYSGDLSSRTWNTTPVGSHPANATPEGVCDMLAFVIGEWCANKQTTNPTEAQLLDASADNDFLTSRAVRGYFHRVPNQSGFLQWFFSSERYHMGRTWTRQYCHPISAVRQAARHGFRIVEEVKGEPAQKQP